MAAQLLLWLTCGAFSGHMHEGQYTRSLSWSPQNQLFPLHRNYLGWMQAQKAGEQRHFCSATAKVSRGARVPPASSTVVVARLPARNMTACIRKEIMTGSGTFVASASAALVLYCASSNGGEHANLGSPDNITQGLAT